CGHSFKLIHRGIDATEATSEHGLVRGDCDHARDVVGVPHDLVVTEPEPLHERRAIQGIPDLLIATDAIAKKERKMVRRSFNEPVHAASTTTSAPPLNRSHHRVRKALVEQRSTPMRM